MKKSPPPQRASQQAIRGAGSVPLYQQVVETLRKQIVDGMYPLGSQLPVESELCESFAVSRHTVREALRRLREEGLVTSRQGAGTTVSHAAVNKPYVQTIDSIQDLIQYARSIRYHTHSTELITCDRRLAAVIGAEAGSQWLRIDGLRYEDNSDAPVCRTTVFVNAAYAGVGRLVARRNTAIYEMIEDLYGERIAEVEQSFRGVEATKAAAADLGVAPGDALIEIKRVYLTASGKRAEVALNLFPFKKFSFAMKLRQP
jgi:DNA-binding GntR family transcriptional regulator